MGRTLKGLTPQQKRRLHKCEGLTPEIGRIAMGKNWVTYFGTQKMCHEKLMFIVRAKN